MRTQLQKKNHKLLAIDKDGDFYTLLSGELEKERVKLLGIKTFLETEEEKASAEIAKEIKNFYPISREVLILLHSPSLYVGRYALPDLPQKEIPNALRWQFKDVISETEENIVFDYLPLKETTSAEGVKQKHYIVCLASRKEIENVISLVEKLKLEPLKITISPFSLEKLIPESDKLYSVLDFSWTTSHLSLYQNRKLIFSRTIPIGVKNLINALGVSIVYKGAHLSLNPEKAWQALKEVGIPESTEGEWQGFPLSQMLVLMRPELERLSLEIIRSLDYFSLKEGNPEKIFITGIGASLKNIDGFLSNSIHREIQLLEFPLETELKLSLQEKLSSYSLLGAILNISHKIDLLPPEYKLIKIRKLKKLINFSASVFILFILISLFSNIPKYLLYKKEVSLYRKQESTLQKIKEMKKELEQKELTLSELIKDKRNFLWIIQDISAILPSQVMLGRLNIANDKSTLEITGIIFAKEFIENIVAETMKKIENSKLIKEPKLDWINKKLEEGKAEFKITAKLK